MAESPRTLAIIPVYNHAGAVATVVKGVRAQGLPCLLVDDGSEPGCAAALDTLAELAEVTLLRLPVNQGKGGAVMAGLLEAERRGFTHALQIDADGQHDTACIPDFLAKSHQSPQSVICGCPVFDASVPRERLYGRVLTQVWVWINTLSRSIEDAMCGFRIYPLATTAALVRDTRLGRRMDFDIDILVRLHWRGLRIVSQPTPVRYSLDGVSHFDMLRDNLAISKLHARLFFGMLWRSPWLVARRLLPSPGQGTPKP